VIRREIILLPEIICRSVMDLIQGVLERYPVRVTSIFSEAMGWIMTLKQGW
jgi:hypothetical protein